MTYRLTRLAEADLLDIAECTTRQWGEDQALKYASDFSMTFERIGENPLALGSRAHDDLLPDCRVIAANSHFVIYRWRNEVTEILRILHRRMSLPLHRLS